MSFAQAVTLGSGGADSHAMSENAPDAAAPHAPGPGPRVGSAREQRARRLAKVDALRARGVNPYPYRFDRDPRSPS
jgi:hypothetical protein